MILEIKDVYCFFVVIDDDILRFDVSVHDSKWVGVVESFEDLIEVKFGLSRSDYLK